MGLLSGKTGVVMGVANEFSIATAIVEVLRREGANIVLSYLPDPSSSSQRMEKRVRSVAERFGIKDVFPCDVRNDESLLAFAKSVEQVSKKIDFIVHSIAFAPTEELDRPTFMTSREGFKLAMDISAYSLLAVLRSFDQMLSSPSSILTLSYIGADRIVPGYNVMGICKAALEAACRYAAYDLGPRHIRVNALSAGPIKTLAASAVSDFSSIESLYQTNSPAKRAVTATEVANAALYLVSDLSSGVTGETHYVDGGFSKMIAPPADKLTT